ncbi:DUF4229 domain-containing protein [Streptomyces sp. NPDC088725]|uniref:DUF4229 domain-containing protein n=1 Tax=Streptomyces sp. NPDC088725 TaxID=3365873 RepID=UPI0038070038
MTTAKPGATVRYTLMRFAIFVGCFVVALALVQFGILPKGLGDSNFIWLLLLAIVISAPLSLVLLRKQRDEMSAQIVGKVDGAKARLEANRSQEDSAAE